VPDETALLKFQRLLEKPEARSPKPDLGAALFAKVGEMLSMSRKACSLDNALAKASSVASRTTVLSSGLEGHDHRAVH
jgi:hypothetical protein